MSNILYDNNLNIKFQCKNNKFVARDKNCKYIGAKPLSDKDRQANQLLPVLYDVCKYDKLNDAKYKTIDINRASTTDVVKARAYRNYLLSIQDINKCKTVRNNRFVYMNDTYKQGFYYLVETRPSGEKVYDLYRKMNGFNCKCGRVIVPNGVTLQNYLSDKSKKLYRYEFNRYHNGKIVKNKYEFCNGAWKFIGEVVF